MYFSRLTHHKNVSFLKESPEVRRSALSVIINCVCAPLARPGGRLLIAPGPSAASVTRRKMAGRSSEELLNKVKA